MREAAKHLGYRGDHVAGSLRRRATATVGVIVADLANPFIAPVIHGIAKSLAAEQMLPLIFETQDDAEQLKWGVDSLLSRRVDAIIVAGARFGDRHVLEAATRFTPVVDRRARHPGQPAPARAPRRPGGRGDGGPPPDRPRPHPPRRAARPDGRRQLRRPPRGVPRRLQGRRRRPRRAPRLRLAADPRGRRTTRHRAARPLRRIAADGRLRPQRPDGHRRPQRVPPARLGLPATTSPSSATTTRRPWTRSTRRSPRSPTPASRSASPPAPSPCS